MKAEALFKVKLAEYERIQQTQVAAQEASTIFAACIIYEAIRNALDEQS